MTGIVGQFFKSFALTIAFAVSMSLLVAFTLDPMLSSRFVRYVPPRRNGPAPGSAASSSAGARFYDGIDRALSPAARVGGPASVDGRGHRRDRVRRQPVVAQHHGHRVRAAGGPRRVHGRTSRCRRARRSSRPSTYVAARRARASSRFPRCGRCSPPSGVENNPLKASLRVKTIEEGRARARPRGDQGGRPRAAQGRAAAEDDGRRSRVHAGRAVAGAAQRLPARRRHGGAAALNEEALDKIKQVRGAVDVDSTLESGQPEMVARINREMAADMGFDVGSVAMQLRGMVEGIVPTRLREGDKEYDIRVRLAPEFRNDFQTLARAPLYSPTGAVVRTPDIVRMEPGVGPPASSARRGGARRRSTSSCRIAPSATSPTTSAAVMAAMTLPAELRVGLRRRRGDDAGVGGGDGPGAAAGRGLHLHRPGVAVRVVPASRS